MRAQSVAATLRGTYYLTQEVVMAQAAIPAPRVDTRGSTLTTDSVRWRWAGGFGIAHIVVLLGAFAIEGVATTHPWSQQASAFADRSMHRIYYASYVEAMAFIVLVPALVLLGGLLGRRTEIGRVAGQVMVGLGFAYVGATLAIGFPPLTTETYAAQHGAGNAVVGSIDMLRNYGFILQVACSLAFTIALGVAALAERTMRKWAGIGGVAVGGIGLLVTPFAHNAINLVWMVWWVGLCVLCLRGGPRNRIEV